MVFIVSALALGGSEEARPLCAPCTTISNRHIEADKRHVPRCARHKRARAARNGALCAVCIAAPTVLCSPPAFPLLEDLCGRSEGEGSLVLLSSVLALPLAPTEGIFFVFQIHADGRPARSSWFASTAAALSGMTQNGTKPSLCKLLAGLGPSEDLLPTSEGVGGSWRWRHLDGAKAKCQEMQRPVEDGHVPSFA